MHYFVHYMITSPPPEQDQEAEVEKAKIVYGPALGATAANDDEDNQDADDGFGTRVVKYGNRVHFYHLPIFQSLIPRPSAFLHCRGNQIISNIGS